MRISKFNVEGYHDPTVYEALVNIEKERKEAQKLVPGRYCPARRASSTRWPGPIPSRSTSM